MSGATEFDELVNMTPKELDEFLDSDESKAVGQKDGGGESTGHASGRRIVAIKRTKKADLAQGGPEDDVEHSKWRYSLMNWGHDPLKD